MLIEFGNPTNLANPSNGTNPSNPTNHKDRQMIPNSRPTFAKASSANWSSSRV
jgi:hypothetical protein